MNKSTLLSLSVSIALATAAGATTVSLSVGFDGPFAFQPDGVTPVNSGTIMLGSLSGTPATSSITDIGSVFDIFGIAQTGTGGELGNTISNLDASAPNFDQRQIYLWIFDGPTDDNSTPHALLTVANPQSPSSGSPWIFPNHIGNGFDFTAIELGALSQGDLLQPDGVHIEGNQIILIPEPSASLLAAIAGVSVALRRRRRRSN